ncbi:MAG: hypothetical protein K2W96_16065 [Gemmataceae bacterium]|nr:hypothetical protein [Gemmataceae bacterium]
MDDAKRVCKVSGHVIAPFKGKDGVIRAVALSPDGKILATAGDDGIRLWDARTGKSLGVLGEDKPQQAIRSLAFSPDGKTLASGGFGVVTWDVAKREKRTSVGTEPKTPEFLRPSVAYTKEGRLLAASALWDKEGKPRVVLVDGATGKTLHEIPKHEKGTAWFVLSKDGKRLAYAAPESTLRLYDTGTGKQVAAIERKSWRPLALAFSPDHSTVAASWRGQAARGGDANPLTCALIVYDAATGKEKFAIPTGEESVGPLDFSPKGALLAVAVTYKPVVQVWELPAK